MAKIQYQGTGRRKSSVARVRLIPGTGSITVNKKPLEDYFGMEIVKREVKRPFEVAGCEGKFDVIATVTGGGFTGQAGALRHGIARALCVADKESFRAPLKAAGFLTRDPRMKERKKYGLKKARRASQFSKRLFLYIQIIHKTKPETLLICSIGFFRLYQSYTAKLLGCFHFPYKGGYMRNRFSAVLGNYLYNGRAYDGPVRKC